MVEQEVAKVVCMSRSMCLGMSRLSICCPSW